jgi:hypothetical protein
MVPGSAVSSGARLAAESGVQERYIGVIRLQMGWPALTRSEERAYSQRISSRGPSLAPPGAVPFAAEVPHTTRNSGLRNSGSAPVAATVDGRIDATRFRLGVQP